MFEVKDFKIDMRKRSTMALEASRRAQSGKAALAQFRTLPGSSSSVAGPFKCTQTTQKRQDRRLGDKTKGDSTTYDQAKLGRKVQDVSRTESAGLRGVREVRRGTTGSGPGVAEESGAV